MHVDDISLDRTTGIALAMASPYPSKHKVLCLEGLQMGPTATAIGFSNKFLAGSCHSFRRLKHLLDQNYMLFASIVIVVPE